MRINSIARLLFAAVASLGTVAAAAPTNPPIGGGNGAGLAILRPCASAQLAAKVSSDTGAMLHRKLRITLTNTSTTACAIDGYPAVRLLDELHHVRIAAESFTGTPKMFIIAPGQKAAFGMRIATGDGTFSYMSVPKLAIIPPGDVVPIMLNVVLPAAPTIEVQPLERA